MNAPVILPSTPPTGSLWHTPPTVIAADESQAAVFVVVGGEGHDEATRRALNLQESVDIIRDAIVPVPPLFPMIENNPMAALPMR